MSAEVSDRKKIVLEAIINDFVETAEPVGSFTITRHYIKDISSATIRHEMHELEEMKYITHPHTSAGRIPTDTGYRYYVDHIMETKTVSGREIALIKSGIKKIGRGMEEILRGTVKIVSSLLNYITVFTTFGRSRVVETSGISNMLKQPEFQKIDSARHVIETIEHHELLGRILEEYSKTNELTVKIGHENRFSATKDLSVVVANLNLKEISPCAIGIIGPTRMDYSRVSSVLKYVSEGLNAAINRETFHV